MGVMNEFGSVERGAARGVLLRMDHGTQHLSDHFQNQVKSWGFAPSFAFLEQPQANGVAERFLRAPKGAGHLRQGPRMPVRRQREAVSRKLGAVNLQ